MRRACLLAVVLVVLLVPLLADSAFAGDFPVQSETVVIGTTTGIADAQEEDGFVEDLNEADTASDPTTTPGTETITTGIACGGTFPTDIQTSNDVRVCRDEALVTVSDVNDYPDAETLNGHSCTGVFPTSLESNNDVYRACSEKTTTADFTSSTQTITKGSQTGGSYPTCIQTSDDSRCTWQEGDQAPATTFLDPDTDSVTIGTKGGTFPGDLTSSNNVYVTVQEANQAPVLSTFFTSFNTGTGTTSIVITVGFQAEAMVLWLSGRTEAVDTVGTADHKRGMGFGTGTADRRAICSQGDDAATIMANDRAHRADAIACSLSIAGAIDGLLDISAISPTQVTFLPDDAFPLSYRVHALFLGGTALTNSVTGQFSEPAATGDQNVVVTGSFQPEALLLMSAMLAADAPAVGVDSALMSGFASGSGNPTDVLWSGGANDGSDPSQTMTYARTGESIALYAAVIPATPAASSVDARAEIDAWNANGFSLNWNEVTAAARDIHYLALDGPSFVTGDFVTSVALDGDITESGFGFSPVAALFVSAAKAEDAADTPRNVEDEWSLGAFVSTTSRGAQSARDDDAVGTQDTGTVLEHDEVYAHSTTGNVLEGLVDIQSIETDGFVLNQDDADPSAFYVGYLAAGVPFDYEVEYRIGWTTETCADTRQLAVEAHITSGGGENVLLQVLDSTETTYTTRITITKTADDNTYQTYTLTADEWDAGDPNVRFLGGTEAADATQSTINIDDLEIRCVPSTDYEMELKFSWTGVPTAGTEHRLFVEGREGAVNPEQLDIRIYAADEVGLSGIVCSITSTTEAEYDCGTLTADQLDAGSPDIQLVDATQTGDTLQSTVELDRIRIRQTGYVFDFVQYDWTGTVPLVDILDLNIRANRTGDAENPHLDLWDWEDLDWNENRITITAATETLFTYSLAAACGAGADNCERSSGSNVRLRAHDATLDGTQTTLWTDELWIREADQDYKLEVRYDFTGVPAAEIYRLTVEGQRTVDTEAINIQLLTPPATWSTCASITTTSDVTYTCDLTIAQYNSGSPSFRLADAGGVAGGQTRTSVDLILVTSITNSFTLDVRHIVTGIAGTDPVLRMKGFLAVAGENFDVAVWDFLAGSWTSWLDSQFTDTNTAFERVLLPGEISGGEVRVRFTDDTPTDDSSSTLEIDVTIVTATDVPDDDPEFVFVVRAMFTCTYDAFRGLSCVDRSILADPNIEIVSRHWSVDGWPVGSGRSLEISSATLAVPWEGGFWATDDVHIALQVRTRLGASSTCDTRTARNIGTPCFTIAPVDNTLRSVGLVLVFVLVLLAQPGRPQLVRPQPGRTG